MWVDSKLQKWCNRTLRQYGVYDPEWNYRAKFYRTRAKTFRLALARFKMWKCECCGQATGRDFEVHHIDGNYMNNRLGNVEVLCKTCHHAITSLKRKRVAELKAT